MAAPNQKLALRLLLVAALMLGASFAAVPFYRLFCQLTGFGGTALRAEAAPAADRVVGDRTISVTFNADAAPDLPWSFKAPVPHTVEVKPGQPVTVSYTATNQGGRPIVGTATHNVQPDRTGPYFNKVECFCFMEQMLQPGESKEFPVTFFIDPDIANDAALDDVKAITLSYTFFLAKDQGKAQAPQQESKP